MNNVVSTLKERATAQLDAQKGRATEGLDAITDAVRQTTEQLRQGRQDTLAQYIDQFAVQLERMSNGVREKSVDELLRDAQQFARRQPGLFIGGSFAAGLVAARFLKSSQRDGGGTSAGDEAAGYPAYGGTVPREPTGGVAGYPLTGVADAPAIDPGARERY